MNITPSEAAMLARRSAQAGRSAAFPVTEGWQGGALVVFVPGRPTHYKGKGHRYTVSKHTKDWRERTATRLYEYRSFRGNWRALLALWPWAPGDPKLIAFTVYTSGRGFDGVDNLKLVCSPVLDALGPARVYMRSGVEVRAHGMGLIDDDKNPAHAITYEQVTKAPVTGIALRIELRKD